MCMYICVMHSRLVPKEDAGPPGTQVKGSSKLPCRFWNSNPGPLKVVSDPNH